MFLSTLVEYANNDKKKGSERNYERELQSTKLRVSRHKFIGDVVMCKGEKTRKRNEVENDLMARTSLSKDTTTTGKGSPRRVKR